MKTIQTVNACSTIFIESVINKNIKLTNYLYHQYFNIRWKLWKMVSHPQNNYMNNFHIIIHLTPKHFTGVCNSNNFLKMNCGNIRVYVTLTFIFFKGILYTY